MRSTAEHHQNERAIGASGIHSLPDHEIVRWWNSERAFPKDGWDELEFDDNPQQKITVYVNGSRYADVYVDGDTRLDIHWGKQPGRESVHFHAS
jgi:hypothetical protein